LTNFADELGKVPSAGGSSGLVMDSAGALYGTIFAGGTGGYGRAYKLTPPKTGTTAWTQTTIYEFDAKSSGPVNQMLRDTSGNLYGTTKGIGGGYGSVFELSPPASAGSYWHKSVLYSFTAATGKPVGGLTAGTGGSLYVPTSSMFIKLTPPLVGHRVWTANTLYKFPLGGTPQGALVLKNGNFYGAAADTNVGSGSIFKLSQAEPGHWTQTDLYDFTGGTAAGLPATGLTFGHDGALYGATSVGISPDNGVVFRFIP
jgi:hypothetical protein